MASERCEMEDWVYLLGCWNETWVLNPPPFGSVRESGWCVQQFPMKFLILAWKNISGNDASLQQNLAGEAKVKTLAGFSHWCEVFCSELCESGMVVAWMCARRLYILLYNLLFAFPTTEITTSCQFYLVWSEMSHTCLQFKRMFLHFGGIQRTGFREPRPHGAAWHSRGHPAL